MLLGVFLLLAKQNAPEICMEGEADSGIAVLRAAVDQAVLHRLIELAREARLTLTTDNATRFNSTTVFEILNRLGITQRRTTYHRNSYIERFHRTIKEDEVSLLFFTSASLAHSSGDLSHRFRAPPPRPGHFDLCSRSARTASLAFRLAEIRKGRRIFCSFMGLGMTNTQLLYA
jgi:transposase InsO family protein